ncbi:MAG: hypothetical protein P8I27_03465, partial [Pirellulaceae bacterium]|nr:hypothetical protein [Pirellulaceae bacterium]
RSTETFDSATDYCHHLAKNYGVLLLPGACLGCEDKFVRIGLGRAGFQTALAAWEATLPTAAVPLAN